MERNWSRRELLAMLGAGIGSLYGCAAISPKFGVTDELKELQEEFLKLRFGLFLHFNMGTFAGLEWANGYEDPKLFAPARLDCGQWADAALEAGMKYAVLTVKHTGGWCLWDSAHTTHDMESFTNYNNGKGDIVHEYVDAFRDRGLKVGLYYCFPGDYTKAAWGSPLPEGKPDLHGLPPEAAGDFPGFMKLQMKELLTNYGPIDIMWIDQWMNIYTWRQWPEIKAYMKSLQPRCLVIGNNARNLSFTDIVGYELPILPIRKVPAYNFLPAEACDTIQKDGRWFWNGPRSSEDLKSAEYIVSMIEQCNSRRANYLLNVQPDADGLLSGAHLERMREIGMLLRRKLGTSQ